MKKISFKNNRNETLHGTVCIPEQYEHGVIVCHDLFQSFHPFYKKICTALSKECITLTFTFNGQGKSDGNAQKSTTTSYLHDLKDAISFLKKTYNVKKVLLIGHGLSSIPTLFMAAHEHYPCITLSGVYHIKDMMNSQLSALQKHDCQNNGFCTVYDDHQNKEEIIGSAFFADLESHDLKDALSLDFPKHFIHGSLNQTIPYTESQALFDASEKPRHFDVIQGGDHFFSDETHFNMVVELCHRFLNTHLLDKEMPY